MLVRSAQLCQQMALKIIFPEVGSFPFGTESVRTILTLSQIRPKKFKKIYENKHQRIIAKKLLILIQRSITTLKLKIYDNEHCIFRKCKKWCSLLALLGFAEATQSNDLHVSGKLKVQGTICIINDVCFKNKFACYSTTKLKLVKKRPKWLFSSLC